MTEYNGVERSTTERLRQLLDKHGVKWEALSDQQEGEFTITATRWHDSECGLLTMCINEPNGSTWDFFWLPTPEQAVEATLGPREQPPYEELVESLRRDWDIEASWDGLRRFWYVGLTDEGVRKRDEREATLGRGTCRIRGGECDQCGVHIHRDAVLCWVPVGESLRTVESREVHYCPNCGRKVEP